MTVCAITSSAPGWIQGDTDIQDGSHTANNLSGLSLCVTFAGPLFSCRTSFPGMFHPCTSFPGTARGAGSCLCSLGGEGKNLFDQILPSRAVNQPPRNANFHKSCSCCTSQVPKHHPTSQSREKNLPNEDPPAQGWLQGPTPKQGNKSQLPLHTPVPVTHLEGTKSILLSEERSSVCSGGAPSCRRLL